MAYKRKHQRSGSHHGYRRRFRRHNPFGVSGGMVKDAAWTAGGALGAAVLPTFFPQFNVGWSGVAATAAGAVAISFVAKMVGGPTAASETLKGGLAIAIVRALHQAGVFKSVTLGLYAPSYFPVPTSSSQYLQASDTGRAFNRGAGTLYFAGPGAERPSAMAGMGYHRFRSRYGGNYGGR